MSDDKTNAAIERLADWLEGYGHAGRPDIQTLIDEVRRLRSLGIVELGAENPEVLEYMEHWETRAKKAEAATDMYAELNRGVAEALGLDPGHSWHDLPRQVRLALNEARSMAAATDRAEQAEAERDEARADLRRFADDVSEGFDCLPGCDSYAHEDLCPVTNPVEAWRQLRAEVGRLRRSQNESIDVHYDRSIREEKLEAEIERLRAALADLCPCDGPGKCGICWYPQARNLRG